MKRKAQGVVESIFAIGILALLLTGAVILVIMGISNRRSSFDRRKATELASIAIEEMISVSQNNPEEFWKLTDKEPLGKEGYEGYVYSITFTNISDNATYPQCGIGKTDCAEAVVSIGWSGKTDQNLYFNRFFSKND
jgi:type II secretory pathway pseudopilin PulG